MLGDAMNFDDIIELIAYSFSYEIPDTQGYGFDMDDEERLLGVPNIEYINELRKQSHKKIDYRNMVASNLILSERFTSIQDVKRVAASVVQSCYYIDFGAHHITCDEHSLVIRYVTVGSSMFVTGSITLCGEHYEKLYQEYLEFLKKFKR